MADKKKTMSQIARELVGPDTKHITVNRGTATCMECGCAWQVGAEECHDTNCPWYAPPQLQRVKQAEEGAGLPVPVYGWVCSRCQRVFAPFVRECHYCQPPGGCGSSR